MTGSSGGGSGWNGSRSAATKTSKLGQDNEKPTTALETARREATSGFRSRWDLSTTWGPDKPLRLATGADFVDSERELELIQSHMAQKPVLRGERKT